MDRNDDTQDEIMRYLQECNDNLDVNEVYDSVLGFPGNDFGAENYDPVVGNVTTGAHGPPLCGFSAALHHQQVQVSRENQGFQPAAAPFPPLNAPAGASLSLTQPNANRPPYTGPPYRSPTGDPTVNGNACYSTEHQYALQASNNSLPRASTQPTIFENNDQMFAPAVTPCQADHGMRPQFAGIVGFSKLVTDETSAVVMRAVHIIESAYQKCSTPPIKQKTSTISQPIDNSPSIQEPGSGRQTDAPNSKRYPYLCPYPGKDAFPLMKSCFNNFRDKSKLKTHLEEHEYAQCLICGDDEAVDDILARHLEAGYRFPEHRESRTYQDEEQLENGHIKIPLRQLHDPASKWSYYSRIFFDDYDTAYEHYLNINVKSFMREVLSYYHQNCHQWKIDGCRAKLPQEAKKVFNKKAFKELAFRFWLPHACRRSPSKEVKDFGEVLHQKNCRTFPNIENLASLE